MWVKASGTWRAFALSVTLSACAQAAAQETQYAAQDTHDLEVIRVDVGLVTLNVSVTDSGKRPVTGLRAEDFLVTDQGRVVSLDVFDTQGPSSIVFVLDVSSSMRGEKWGKLTRGLKKFLSRARPENDYTLVTFGDTTSLVAEGVGADELWQSVSALEPSGHTALYDALLVGLDALGRSQRRHKALVLLSDGQDNRSRSTLEEVGRAAGERRATLYTVGIIRRRDHLELGPPLREEEREGKRVLEGLASATGGLAYFPGPGEVRRVLDGIEADLSGQYTLGYYAPEGGAGWRQVKVSVTGEGAYRLRYQQLYLKR